MIEENNSRTSEEGTEETAKSSTSKESEAEKGSGEGQSTEEQTDWKSRYDESSREAHRLLSETKVLKEQQIADRARLATLEKEMRELDEVAKSVNPQNYDANLMRKQYDKLASDLASIKEEQELDRFLTTVPIAGKYRESLRDLGRAFPGKGYSEIWNTHFFAIAEAEKVLAETKKTREEAGGERGKGTSTGELSSTSKIGGYTIEQFNKLTLAKRREVLLKEGISEVKPLD